ncbi:hypothetical protein Bca101_050423 [Brassica carinata]
MGICFSAEEQFQFSQQQNYQKKKSSGKKSAVYLMNSECKESSVGGKPSPSGLPLPPKNIKDLQTTPGYENVDIFTYQEMKLATKQFRPDYILGEGGFGVVYKGLIDDNVRPGYNSTKVAIKELNPEGFQGDREWLRSSLGFLSLEDLMKHLLAGVGCTLTWSKRVKIALDAAKGLAFLHGAERSIIYRDLKTANILLDECYNAKLADFGLAKDGPRGDQTHVSTRVMGTYGYAAPEYVMTGHLTSRSDVYGYGVLLLEMLLGKRAMDKSRPCREHNLVEWARPLLNHNKKLLRIIDPRMDGQYTTKALMKVADLAYQCLSQNPKGRPLMSHAVQVLETLKEDGDAQGEVMASLHSRGKSVTLHEAAPSDSQGTRNVDGDGQGQRRRRPESGRSKSEASVDTDLYVSALVSSDPNATKT